jgi:hypothetical protein
LGQLKAKLAKLRRELIVGTGGSGGGGGGIGFDVARFVPVIYLSAARTDLSGRTGIASVGFVGFPSVGKVFFLIISHKMGERSDCLPPM